MPDCFFVTKLLSDYMDDMVNPVHKEQVHDHLSECKSCARLFDALKKQSQRFSSAAMKTLPKDLVLQFSRGGKWYHRFDIRNLSPVKRYLAECAIVILLISIFVIWAQIRFRFF